VPRAELAILDRGGGGDEEEGRAAVEGWVREGVVCRGAGDEGEDGGVGGYQGGAGECTDGGGAGGGTGVVVEGAEGGVVVEEEGGGRYVMHDEKRRSESDGRGKWEAEGYSELVFRTS